MTEENKLLLLKDLSARLPYKVKVNCTYDGNFDGFPEDSFNTDFVLTAIDFKYPNNIYWIGGDQLKEKGIPTDTLEFATRSDDDEEVVKPYLRPMSSMTEEERNQYNMFQEVAYNDYDGTSTTCIDINQINEYIDWLNAHHFDYRNLIEKGLALPAPEDMYKID